MSIWPFNKKKQDRVVQAIQQQDDQNYWAIVRRQFRKNRLAVWSLRFFFVILLVALLADFIANDKPLICTVEITETVEGKENSRTKTLSPILYQYFVDLGLAKWDKAFLNIEWDEPVEKKFKYKFVVFPPITYMPERTDVLNSSVGPFDKQKISEYKRRHFLGTDHIGRDVAAGMIHGTRIAMLVGIVAMSIATFIGILLGAMAGYFGDDRMKVTRASIVFNFLGVFVFVFFAFVVRGYTMGDNIGNGYLFYEMIVNFGLFVFIMALANAVGYLFKPVPWLGHSATIPIDIIVMRLIEVVTSVPVLILILAILAIIKTSSIFYVMAIIGSVSWTGIAKFIRAELLRVRSLEYIEAAQAFGYSELRIIWKHAIPNALAPVLIAIAFGIASAILTESFLSFIGVGVPPEQVTWGALLKASRDASIDAWWLAVFPGVAIFISVTIFNLLGEGLTDALDPRMKQ
jgi:peptide/nickel transport system permease protein